MEFQASIFNFHVTKWSSNHAGIADDRDSLLGT
jgi:hypothetical protein